MSQTLESIAEEVMLAAANGNKEIAADPEHRHCVADAFRIAAGFLTPTKKNREDSPDLLAQTCMNGMAYSANELRLLAHALSPAR
jgi:hypothetical protein